MKTIEIDDDIYAYLLSRTAAIGETASSILRREVPSLSHTNKQQQPSAVSEGPHHELRDLLASSKMKAWNSTDKYLLVLSEAYKQKKPDFEKILPLRGRDRRYFAGSEAEIERSGVSTAPKRIPESPYWALTNLTTSNKQSVLRQALRLLNYSAAAVDAAVKAIA